MIWFDNHQLMRTPSYYIQKLFMEHQGSIRLPQKLTGAGEPVKLYPFPDELTGGLVLSGDESTVEFWDIVIKNLDTGERMEYPETVLCKGGETHPVSQIDWHSYSISLKAREVEGWKGFYIWFAQRNGENKLCWQLGGWNNGDSLISEYINGKDSVLTQKERHIEKDRVYTLEVRVRGRRIEAFVDGEKELETEVLPTMAESLYTVSSRDCESGDIIVKLVNILSQPQTVTKAIINRNRSVGTINKNIYGHFSEHLGRCIYDGIYVGEDSSIPNVNGMRTDVVEALKKMGIPLLRWPGGASRTPTTGGTASAPRQGARRSSTPTGVA